MSNLKGYSFFLLSYDTIKDAIRYYNVCILAHAELFEEKTTFERTKVMVCFGY